jgi:hypothetical protein
VGHQGEEEGPLTAAGSRSGAAAWQTVGLGMASTAGIGEGDVSTETQARVMRWSDDEGSGIISRSGPGHGAEGVWGRGIAGSHYPQETLGEGRIEGG